MFELPSGAEIQGIIASVKASVGFFIPEIYLSLLFMLLIVVDLVSRGKKNNLLSITTLVGLAGSLFFIHQQQSMQAGELFFGMYVLDEFALFFKYFFVLSGMLLAPRKPGPSGTLPSSSKGITSLSAAL